MTQGLGQKIVEWAVVAALVGVIGYLIGNSDAMTMKNEIEQLRAELGGLQEDVKELQELAPRRLDMRHELRKDAQ